MSRASAARRRRAERDPGPSEKIAKHNTQTNPPRASWPWVPALRALTRARPGHERTIAPHTRCHAREGGHPVIAQLPFLASGQDRAAHSVGSPPPCGEGLGVGVLLADATQANNCDPHPASLRSATLPTRGRVGARCRTQHVHSRTERRSPTPSSTAISARMRMKLHYYPETDSLYIELKSGPGAEARGDRRGSRGGSRRQR